MSTIAILAQVGPVCREIGRRAAILAHPTLNGIDFVEYELRPADPQPHVLEVTFLKPLPEPTDPDGAWGLTLHPELIVVDGGTRVRPIHVLSAARVGPRLEVRVDQAGDFSRYWLALGWRRQADGIWQPVIPGLDSLFSLSPINFKAGCPVEFDCRQETICPPEPVREPVLDYLAKDYASFRQLLVDNLPLLNPNWRERNPADLGMMLLELLAYEGDRISYFQDAVANEAFLDTVRQRVSARRHARLVDYRMHDGRNAWTYLHLNVTGTGTVPPGTKALTRVTVPLRGQILAPGRVISEVTLAADAFTSDPALRRVRVFETLAPQRVDGRNNVIQVHTWGNSECCLGRATTTLHVYALGPVVAGERQVIAPVLEPGDLLLLEEVLGPTTANPADADPEHRQVVRLTKVETSADPAFRDRVLADGTPQVFAAGDTEMPLLRVTWDRRDALEFPLCLSSRPPGQPTLRDVSIARGNIVAADHGRSLVEVMTPPEPLSGGRPARISFGSTPLTMRVEQIDHDSRQAQPAIGAVTIDLPSGPESWQPVEHLLDSQPFSQHFVAELDEDGRASLRFGDGEYGQFPEGATRITATYRVGSGRAGNIGAEALFHVIQPVVAPAWPAVNFVRNPIAARGGHEAETIEEVRQLAPAAFRAEQLRAVTEADYANAARKMPDVAGAVAAFRWTGSWYTVFIAVDPRDPADLITEPGGRTRLTPAFEQRVRAFVTRFKLAGYDLEIRSARYVPLEIDMELCVRPAHFRGDVVRAVLHALSNRTNADRSRGFFHPDNFTFGNPVYLSRLYAAVEAVEGVDSVFVTRFHRFGELPKQELATGVLDVGTWEIARLDNDRNAMENGVLRITAGGGK
jgi:hypothetical protein